MRWGYGGRRWSCNGEEGGEGELDAPRTTSGEGRARAMLTVVVLATAEAAGQRWPWRSDSEGRLRTGRWRGRDERRKTAVGRAASTRALSGRRRRGRGELSGRVALSRCVSTACGGHAATARCRTGPAQRHLTGGARLSMISELKFTPKEISLD
jgi:hypothetical protein